MNRPRSDLFCIGRLRVIPPIIERPLIPRDLVLLFATKLSSTPPHKKGELCGCSSLHVWVPKCWIIRRARMNLFVNISVASCAIHCVELANMTPWHSSFQSTTASTSLGQLCTSVREGVSKLVLSLCYGFFVPGAWCKHRFPSLTLWGDKPEMKRVRQDLQMETVTLYEPK